MTNPELHELRRAWAIRMARLGRPDYEIAFKLGISMEDLRLNFAKDMQLSVIDVNIRVLQNLLRQALSSNCPASTRFWVKHQIWSQSGLKKTPKSNDSNKKQRTWGSGNMADIVFHGPNGETA